MEPNAVLAPPSPRWGGNEGGVMGATGPEVSAPLEEGGAFKRPAIP